MSDRSSPQLSTLPENQIAIVIGATGGIGRAFVELLHASDHFAKVLEYARTTDPALDLTHPHSIAACAEDAKNHARV